MIMNMETEDKIKIETANNDSKNNDNIWSWWR